MKKTKRQTIGENIKKARKAKGMTQIELAQAVELTQGAISDIESGETKSPLYETVEKIALELDCGVTDLKGGIYLPWEGDEIDPPHISDFEAVQGLVLTDLLKLSFGWKTMSVETKVRTEVFLREVFPKATDKIIDWLGKKVDGGKDGLRKAS